MVELAVDIKFNQLTLKMQKKKSFHVFLINKTRLSYSNVKLLNVILLNRYRISSSKRQGHLLNLKTVRCSV